MSMQTVFSFTLPKGLLNEAGEAQRDGEMRLATAGDELAAMRDPRAKADPACLPLLILARVILHIGSIKAVTYEHLEGLFSQDFQYLQEMYEVINQGDEARIHVTCPHCGQEFDDSINFTRPV